MADSERTLWTERNDNRSIRCVMRSCCTGAELQILIAGAPGHEPDVVLRELYPTKSDLYERARQLAAHYRDGGAGGGAPHEGGACLANPVDGQPLNRPL